MYNNGISGASINFGKNLSKCCGSYFLGVFIIIKKEGLFNLIHELIHCSVWNFLWQFLRSINNSTHLIRVNY